MGAEMSVQEVLSTLEARAAFHREQEAFHAQQEVHHRDQRAHHAAELEKVEQSLEAFRAAAPSAVELARPLAPKSTTAKADETSLPPPGRKFVSGLLRLVIQNSELQEPFGPSAVAEAANRRFKDHLREPIAAKTASDVLRRMLAEGEIQLVRKGKAVHQAQYRRLCGGGRP